MVYKWDIQKDQVRAAVRLILKSCESVCYGYNSLKIHEMRGRCGQYLIVLTDRVLYVRDLSEYGDSFFKAVAKLGCGNIDCHDFIPLKDWDVSKEVALMPIDQLTEWVDSKGF